MRALMLLAGLALTLAFSGAAAQVGPGGAINPQKDCQTLVTCNFRKGGSYRGCLSSYSCRQCRFVATSCRIGPQRGRCQELRCTWG